MAEFFVTWILAGLCKLGVLVSFPFLLVPAFSQMSGRPRVSLLFVRYWAIGLLSLLVLLAFFRDTVCDALNNDAARYYPVSQALTVQSSSPWVGRDQWLPRWRSGGILFCEGLFTACFLSIWGVVGCKFGGRCSPFAAALAACLAFPVLLAIYVSLTQFSVVDYDVFFGSIYTDPLSWDLWYPFVFMDISTPLLLIAALVFWLATLLALRATERQTPDA